MDKIRAEDACAGAELGRESAGGVRDSPRTRSRLCRFARVAVTKCQLGLRQQCYALPVLEVTSPMPRCLLIEYIPGPSPGFWHQCQVCSGW